jgi:hypothetical protein
LTEKANVEPQEGGLYELFWNPADPRNNNTIDCRFVTLVENRLISFDWRSPQQFKHFANDADPLTQCVVSFSRLAKRPKSI